MKTSIGRKLILPRVVTINSFQHNFQYKILHNILYLNKVLFTFGIIKTPQCSFCHSYDETINHTFLECICVKKLWIHLRLFLRNDISLPIQRHKLSFLVLLTKLKNVYKITNHILLIFNLRLQK